jgi:pimeloyl-ACP methyl ester carboxylesterase/tetratricopeptide (TPR) repeat protein
MTRHTSALRANRFCSALCLCVLLVSGEAVRAEKVTLIDGRVLDGLLAPISGVAEEQNAGEAAGGAKPILMCDNHLTRTFVPKRMVKLENVDRAPPRDENMEHFQIKQPVADNGAPLASLGPTTLVKDWDPWGRRTYGMVVAGKNVNVVQGLTEITPVWSRIETLQATGISFLWDMRIATSTIPRDVLNQILKKQINPRNPDHRLKLVRFYMQAERYQDAEAELKELIDDFKNFPNLPPQLDQVAKSIRQLRAQQGLAEIERLKAANQHRLADGMLRIFPSDDVSGVILEEVRNKIENYDKIQKHGEQIIHQFDDQIGKVKDKELTKQLKPLRDEIQKDLWIPTLDRLAPFARLADDADMLPEQKLALAISGWLVGPNDAIDNLQTALSLAETRNIIRNYMTEPLKMTRDRLLEPLSSQQAASPRYVALLLSHMKPPLDNPDRTTSGSYKFDFPAIRDEPLVTCLVQTPPEYDPYVKYPAIVALNGENTTAEQMIDYWCGLPREAPKKVTATVDPTKSGKIVLAAAKVDAADAAKQSAKHPEPPKPGDSGGLLPPGARFGQAARHGYIVIAPVWTKPHQFQYEYSAREHAAVLGALREACKRFSIDTDRVYLTGHSMGGDAAWDIALAHPDLWAGVIPITARTDRYVERYSQNGAHLPMYFVGGELDGDKGGTKTTTNAPQWDKYFKHAPFDITLVEYLGRGHENFSDEILRMFDWMGRKKRDFFPKRFTVSTMRNWDNFFWSVELSNMPANQMVDPEAWPPPRGLVPLTLDVKALANNGINVDMHAANVTVWLSPELVSFERPINVTINGTRVAGGKGAIKPSIPLMLEDARTRADRQHPFWAKVER